MRKIAASVLSKQTGQNRPNPDKAGDQRPHVGPGTVIPGLVLIIQDAPNARDDGCGDSHPGRSREQTNEEDQQAGANRPHGPGDRLEVKVEAGPSFVPFLGPSQGVWRFQLTQEIPLTLRVEAGASSLNIDLKDVLASHVELNTGASSSNVTVPARGVSLLDIDAGAASVNIRVPEATAARIRVEEGVNSVNVDTKRFPRLDPGFYQSTGYDTAPDRADINIQAGLGSVTVR